jgi:putative transposase
MVPQASYLQGENQAGVFGPGLIDRKGLVHLTDPTASSAGSYACGDPSGGGTALLGWSTSHGSVKQEVARHHRPLER